MIFAFALFILLFIPVYLIIDIVRDREAKEFIAHNIDAISIFLKEMSLAITPIESDEHTSGEDMYGICLAGQTPKRKLSAVTTKRLLTQLKRGKLTVREALHVVEKKGKHIDPLKHEWDKIK